MNAKSFHVSVQGSSHIKKNKECQDASMSYMDDNCSIAIVCDGHGGDDYVRSAIGSKLAAGAADKNIKKFIGTVGADDMRNDHKKLLKNLEASIINVWNEAIHSYHEKNPFSENELSIVSDKAKRKYTIDKRIESAYGTTLIAVAVTRDYWFGIHIGDGKCVAINPEGRFSQPIPWDEKCFLNATTSICDSSALDNFREFYSEKLPVAVFVGSDGIDDSFRSDEQLNNFYKTVLYSFTSNAFDKAYEEFKDYLPRLSAKGSGDDVSVAAILDMDLIGELEVVKAFDEEKEKAKVIENARREAEKNEIERSRIEANHAKQLRKAANISEDLVTCKNCGTVLRKGVKFCSECGQAILQNKNEDAHQSPIAVAEESEVASESASPIELVESTALDKSIDADESIELDESMISDKNQALNEAAVFDEALAIDENVVSDENILDDASLVSDKDLISDKDLSSDTISISGESPALDGEIVPSENDISDEIE
ncbi:protein phosphatase 2C domain-containing protein [Fusibacter bizertensis]